MRRLASLALVALAVAAAGCGPAARAPSPPPPPARARPATLDEAYARVKDAHDVASVFRALGAPDEIVGRGVTMFVYRYPPDASLRITAADAQPESPVLSVKRAGGSGE